MSHDFEKMAALPDTVNYPPPAMLLSLLLKGKGFPYSLPIGPGADPDVQAVSPQVIHPTVGCHYFPLNLRLPSQPQSITVPWPVPSYTAW